MVRTGDRHHLQLTGSYALIQDDVINAAECGHPMDMPRPSEGKPVASLLGGIREAVTQYAAHRRMVIRRIEIPHEHISRIRVRLQPRNLIK